MNQQKRPSDRLRPVSFELSFTRFAEGSVLCRFGETHVLCNATVEEDVPRWMKTQEEERGWLTAEYNMLPRSTPERRRDRLFPDGRSQEISRLIGRALRMAVDLHALGRRQIILDCTVLQADGGTRTAAVTGGWLAVRLALEELLASGKVSPHVVRHQIAAVSVGTVDGEPFLDLAYEQDSRAGVDLNVVMTGDGDLVEIQGTAESGVFSRQQLDTLLDLAWEGIEQLVRLQRNAFERA
ncbi:MAG: ribonuclease PH [Candidatus Promineifilaceae bacterium]|nr:ribonuclease PH [Candidatus Promineifilaceae bacterium]